MLISARQAFLAGLLALGMLSAACQPQGGYPYYTVEGSGGEAGPKKGPVVTVHLGPGESDRASCTIPVGPTEVGGTSERLKTADRGHKLEVEYSVDMHGRCKLHTVACDGRVVPRKGSMTQRQQSLPQPESGGADPGPAAPPPPPPPPPPGQPAD